MLPFGWRKGGLWTQKFPAPIFLFAGCSLLLLLLPRPCLWGRERKWGGGWSNLGLPGGDLGYSGSVGGQQPKSEAGSGLGTPKQKQQRAFLSPLWPGLPNCPPQFFGLKGWGQLAGGLLRGKAGVFFLLHPSFDVGAGFKSRRA